MQMAFEVGGSTGQCDVRACFIMKSDGVCTFGESALNGRFGVGVDFGRLFDFEGDNKGGNGERGYFTA